MTFVSSVVAKQENLARTNLAQIQPTICSTETDPLVHSGSWSIPGLVLHSQLLASTSFSHTGIVGTLGSDQLIRHKWVVFDYTGARLILG